MREHGALSVTWLSPAPPWVAYRVVVDDIEVGRISYHKPAYIDLPPGEHTVELLRRGARPGSEAVPVEISDNGRLDLFGGRRLPSSEPEPRDGTGAAPGSVWLGVARAAPPIVESRSTRSGTATRVWMLAAAACLILTIVGVSLGLWLVVAISAVLLVIELGFLRRDSARHRRMPPAARGAR